MRKIFMSLLLIALVMAMGSMAYAVDYPSPEGLYVSYDGEEIESNLDTEDVFDLIQPGDSATVEIEIRNDAEGNTDWWMNNSVLETFEDAEKEAAGGAYTYILTYTDKNGEDQVIYSSDSVGGDEGQDEAEGLKEATGSLEDFFFLETLEEGDTAKVKLYVALDGETQGNNYQTKDADLRMRFAVEVPNSSVVKTGDDHNFTLLYIGMLVGGLGLLYFVLDGITDRKYFGKRKG